MKKRACQIFLNLIHPHFLYLRKQLSLSKLAVEEEETGVTGFLDFLN